MAVFPHSPSVAARELASPPVTPPAASGSRWRPESGRRAGLGYAEGPKWPPLAIEVDGKRPITREVTHGKVPWNRCSRRKLDDCRTRSERASAAPERRGDASPCVDRRRDGCRGHTEAVLGREPVERVALRGAREARRLDRSGSSGAQPRPQERCARRTMAGGGAT